MSRPTKIDKTSSMQVDAEPLSGRPTPEATSAESMVEAAVPEAPSKPGDIVAVTGELVAETIDIPTAAPYPVVIQHYRPEGITIELINPENLNPRKLEAGLIQSFHELRRVRMAIVRGLNDADQVATDPVNEVRLKEPKEASWPQQQTAKPSPSPQPEMEESNSATKNSLPESQQSLSPSPISP